MKRIIFIIQFIVFACISLNAATIWQEKDIYATDKNLQVGDIIVVNIRDFSKLKFDITLVNNSSSDIISNPDMTITGFLPKVSANKNIKNNESTNFTGNSRIEMAIATRIVNRQNNGFSAIAGTRTYTFNGVTSTISVSGIVDPRLLNGTSIDSGYVADFRIQITGRKEGLTVRKNQITGEQKATTELTETEKQQIVIDYLEKIIRELTK